MNRAIFISYRRDDTEGEAGRLFDDLTRAFGEKAVFMDVDGITPGTDFRNAIDENVSACGVLLAVIGKTWASIPGPDGSPRLDAPQDFVRLEIATALRRNIAVIPVLVHGAQMPRSDDLPDELRDLAFRNGVEITHARWNSDVQLLVGALQHYIAPGSVNDTHTVHAQVPVQLPPPTAPGPQDPPAPKRAHSGRLVIGASLVAVVALGIAFYFHGRNTPVPAVNGTDTQAATTPVSTPAQSGSEGKAREVPAAVTPATSAPANAEAAPGMPLHPNLYAGSWSNPSPEPNNGLLRLEVTRQEGGMAMHAWGNCERTECDWGTVPGTMNMYRLEGKFQLGPNATMGTPSRVALVSIFPQRGTLDVMISNTFANRPGTYRQFTFERAR